MEGKEKKRLVTREDIERADKTLKELGLTHPTPLLRNCHQIYPLILSRNPELISFAFKLESMQTMGCFKTRGVANLMANLQQPTDSSKPITQRGMVTMSTGNFGRTFAFVARQKSIPALVIMPTDVPEDRIRIISDLGARVELVPRMDLQKRVDHYVREESMIYAHPFDDPLLMAAYATIGLEVMQDWAEVDTIVVGVGGGGLISGIATGIKEMASLERRGKIRVIGVEAKGAPKMFQSLKEGHAVRLEKIETFVSGLAPPFAGELAFEHVKQYVDEIVLVEDEEVKEAMRIMFRDFKMVVEPAGAATLAALLYGKVTGGKNVCCVVSGGNVSLPELQKVLA